MAINPDEYRRLRKQLDDLVEDAPVDENNQEFIKNEVFEPAFSEIDAIVEESREPRLYVFGRSGAGKSSLINKLAEKEVAEVGNVEPTTPESKLYHIEFPEDYSNWEIVDSRGLFETVSPGGSPSSDTVEMMEQDLRDYRPDILIHVITPDQLRAGKQDFEAIQELREEIGEDQFPPVLYCLNKIDVHLPVGAGFPPDDHPSVAGDIKENLHFMMLVLEEWEKTTLEKSPFEDNRPICGYTFDSERHIGVIPIYLKGDPYWNVENLRWVIGDFLPNDARLQYAQANRQEELMRELSADVRMKFSISAGTVGAAPGPVVDIAVLTPMQWALIWVTAGLSCRELGRENANEYLKAMGLSALGGLALRKLARSLSQLVPFGGQVISASAAFIMTWTLGRSAELYFFDGEEYAPRALKDDARERFKEYKEQIY